MSITVDFIVTAKRDYEGELTHLKVRKIRENEAMNPEARSKADVVQDILVEDKTYYLAEQDDEEGYVLGKQLRACQLEGEYFLRTDDKTAPDDSLPELPNF